MWYLGENHDAAREQFADYPSVRDEIFEKLQWPQRLRSVMPNSVAELGAARRFARGPDDRFQLVACFRDGPDRPSFFPLQNLRIGLDYPLNKQMFEGRRPFRRHRRNQPGQEIGVQTDNCDASNRGVQADCDDALSDLDEDQYGFSYDADVDTADEDRPDGGHLSPPASAENDQKSRPAGTELGEEFSPAPAESDSDVLSEASEGETGDPEPMGKAGNPSDLPNSEFGTDSAENQGTGERTEYALPVSAFQPKAETRPRSRSADARVNFVRIPHSAVEEFAIAARRRKPIDTRSTSTAPPSKKADTSRAHDAASHGEAQDEDDRTDTYSPEL